MKQRPKLQLDNKIYFFSTRSIKIFLIGAPILAILLYLFFDSEINNWLKELVAKQSAFVLENIFNVKSHVTSENHQSWSIYIPSIDQSYSIHSWCTAAHVFSIFIAYVILIPSSLDESTGRKMYLRKLKVLALLLIIIYLGNITRIAVVIYMVDMGYSWELSHTIVNYLTGTLAALLFIYVLYKWIPEFYISIYYLYPLYMEKKKK